MSNYVIFADSACDIKPSVLAEWGVKTASLTFRFDGEEKEYSNNDMDTKVFYDKMRAGGTAKTSAINVERFAIEFENVLLEGNDVLYLGFSSGLSTTYNSARLAAERLREKHPERKIITIDTLSASAGFGMIVYLAVKEKEKGATIEQAATLAEGLKMRLCHWFTVDDLVYLKRGGRISPAVAFVGGVLGIKPVLHMDNEGHLINMFKVRGRKTAVASLADKYSELAENAEAGPVFISHADCIKDVEELADILKKKHGVEVEIVADVGPVIGAHSGPGTLALFFVGKER
ncbi:MAG: DegV family protein [Clostridia bacterium]|nr:DegV family protein [Clostridia bacterium]